MPRTRKTGSRKTLGDATLPDVELKFVPVPKEALKGYAHKAKERARAHKGPNIPTAIGAMLGSARKPVDALAARVTSRSKKRK